MRRDALEHLTVEELGAFVAVHSKLSTLPGVRFVQPEFIDREDSQKAVVVYLDARRTSTLDLLPAVVEQMPVVVRLEDRITGRVLECIDMRRGWSDASSMVA